MVMDALPGKGDAFVRGVVVLLACESRHISVSLSVSVFLCVSLSLFLFVSLSVLHLTLNVHYSTLFPPSTSPPPPSFFFSCCPFSTLLLFLLFISYNYFCLSQCVCVCLCVCTLVGMRTCVHACARAQTQHLQVCGCAVVGGCFFCIPIYQIAVTVIHHLGVNVWNVWGWRAKGDYVGRKWLNQTGSVHWHCKLPLCGQCVF